MSASGTSRARPRPCQQASSAPACTSSSRGQAVHAEHRCVARPAIVPVCEYPSDSQGKPVSTQPRHHSPSSHSAGSPAYQRQAPRAGRKRAASQPSSALVAGHEQHQQRDHRDGKPDRGRTMVVDRNIEPPGTDAESADAIGDSPAARRGAARRRPTATSAAQRADDRQRPEIKGRERQREQRARAQRQQQRPAGRERAWRARWRSQRRWHGTRGRDAQAVDAPPVGAQHAKFVGVDGHSLAPSRHATQAAASPARQRCRTRHRDSWCRSVR